MKLPYKICLVGYMGSGKSSLGKKLANQLGYRFYDLDKLIEAKAGRSIPEIFNEQGEAHFRELEAAMLKEAIQSDDCFVMALGGGTPCYADNMDLILNQSTAIYLKYNPGILVSRLKQAKADRPLIAGKTDDELFDYIERSLSERAPYYEKSQVIVEDDNVTAKKVMASLEQAM